MWLSRYQLNKDKNLKKKKEKKKVTIFSLIQIYMRKNLWFTAINTIKFDIREEETREKSLKCRTPPPPPLPPWNNKEKRKENYTLSLFPLYIAKELTPLEMDLVKTNKKQEIHKKD